MEDELQGDGRMKRRSGLGPAAYAHVPFLSLSLPLYIPQWVNNAGRGINKSILDVTEEDFDEMMNVNAKSAMFGMQAAYPYFVVRMEGREGGREGRRETGKVKNVLGRVMTAPQITTRPRTYSPLLLGFLLPSFPPFHSNRRKVTLSTSRRCWAVSPSPLSALYTARVNTP